MKKVQLLFVLVFSVMITNCGTGQKVLNESEVQPDPHVGTWSLLIEDTPQGNVAATMTIAKNPDGNYTGKVNSDLGMFNLNDLKIMDHKLAAGFVIQDMPFDLMGNFESLLFKGFVSGMGEDYPANGKKVEE